MQVTDSVAANVEYERLDLTVCGRRAADGGPQSVFEDPTQAAHGEPAWVCSERTALHACRPGPAC